MSDIGKDETPSIRPLNQEMVMFVKRILLVGVGCVTVGMSIFTLGCTVDSLVNTTPGLQRFSSLQITPKSVSMTAGATQQFTVVARDTLGVEIPLSELPAATFTSRVDTAISVTQTGLATAHFAGNNLSIIAKIVVNNLAYADTALVNVVATQPAGGPPATLSVVTSDSGFSVFKVAVGTTKNLTATVNGGPPGNTVIAVRQPYYVSSDRKVAIVTGTNTVEGRFPGTAEIIGRITAFGVNLVDTVFVTVTHPMALTVDIVTGDNGAQFGGTGQVTIAPGGTITWRNVTAVAANSNVIPPTPAIPAVPMDVTFDNPTNVAATTTTGASGNIPVFTTGSQARKFPVAGTYTYKSTTNGATGVVIVK